MKKSKLLGALEIGSEKIALLIGQVANRHLNILGNISVPSRGVHKGVIVDIKASVAALKECFKLAQKEYKGLPEQLFLAQSGAHLRSIHHSTNVQLGAFNGLVSDQDIARVKHEAKNKQIPDKDLFLHHFLQGFSVDGNPVKEPYGRSGSQLSVHYCSLFGNAQAIKDALYSVNQFGFRIEELVFSGLASALSVTSTVERENGVCVLDLGAETTDFIVYKNQRPIRVGTLPVGGRNFTHDLCSGLRLHFEDGEQLKKEHGIPMDETEFLGEKLWVIGNQSIGDKMVKKKSIQTILGARAEELFDTVRMHCTQTSAEEYFLSGVILTGGGALLKNIERVAAKVFKVDVHVRAPLLTVDDRIKKPHYATCLGLLCYAMQTMDKHEEENSKSFWKRFSDWFNV